MNEQPSSQRFIRLLLALCLLSIPLGLMLFFPQPPPVHAAASFTVNSLGDAPDDKPGDGICRSVEMFCTLRAAIMEANALLGADTIAFSLTLPATIVLGSPLPTITEDLTINGPGAPSLLTISGDDLYRVMQVNPRVTLNLSGVTIAKGNTSSMDGGGIFNNGGTVNISNSSIYSNSAGLTGGGISSNGTVNMTNTTVYSNSASNNGGGIYSVGTLNITGTSFYSNSTSAGGGGILNIGTLNITNSSIYSNTAIEIGGGIDNHGTLNIINSTFSGNSGAGGGGISSEGPVNITNTTVYSNTAYSFGGGIFKWGSGGLTLTNSTVYSNTAGFDGGGIFNFGGLTMINSTLSGNTANRDGGGIANQGAASLLNATITNNQADGNFDGIGTGGGISNTGTFNFSNTILALNSETQLVFFNKGVHIVPFPGECAGTLTSFDYNLLTYYDSSHCTISGSTGNTLFNTDPLLGPLANNGGPTLTHALLPGSPAINRIPNGTNGCGTTITTDQRSTPRPIGAGCDIGAFEAVYLFLPLIEK